MTKRRRDRNEAPGPPGFLIVDKPAGWTSHDVVDAARKLLGTRRVGHLGTLDPQATGVLPLAVREATKLVPFFEGSRKRYIGTIRFGQETDTLDGEGQVLRTHDGPMPSEVEVARALEAFHGDIEQIPPMYSAVKQGGVPLHKLARKGEEVARQPKKVRIHEIRVLGFEASTEATQAEIEVECSAGTYVRTLAADLGTQLGCGAFLQSLRRTASGPFSVEQAVAIETLQADADAGRIEERLIPPAIALGIPTWTLTETALRRVRNGGDVPPGTALRIAPGARVAAVDEEGDLVAVLELRADRRLWPLRVLRPAE